MSAKNVIFFGRLPLAAVTIQDTSEMETLKGFLAFFAAHLILIFCFFLSTLLLSFMI